MLVHPSLVLARPVLLAAAFLQVPRCRKGNCSLDKVQIASQPRYHTGGKCVEVSDQEVVPLSQLQKLVRFGSGILLSTALASLLAVGWAFLAATSSEAVCCQRGNCSLDKVQIGWQPHCHIGDKCIEVSHEQAAPVSRPQNSAGPSVCARNGPFLCARHNWGLSTHSLGRIGSKGGRQQNTWRSAWAIQ